MVIYLEKSLLGLFRELSLENDVGWYFQCGWLDCYFPIIENIYTLRFSLLSLSFEGWKWLWKGYNSLRSDSEGIKSDQEP